MEIGPCSASAIIVCLFDLELVLGKLNSRRLSHVTFIDRSLSIAVPAEARGRARDDFLAVLSDSQ